MLEPYYANGTTSLYLGDMREIVPQLPERPDACVTDPPYGETVAAWDVWPDGWVKAVGAILRPSASLWCFGSARMFLERAYEFHGWRYAQEQLWVKANGSGPTGRDRLVKVHEWAYHWYRGRWGDLHHEWERQPATTPNKGYVRKPARSAPHQRDSQRVNAWQDDGMRQPRSVAHVVEAAAVRYHKRLVGEKPLQCVLPLVRECTPPGGLVLDPFAGSGTTAVAARACGRRAVLVEANERHAEAIAERLQSELPVGAVSGSGEPTKAGEQ